MAGVVGRFVVGQTARDLGDVVALVTQKEARAVLTRRVCSRSRQEPRPFSVESCLVALPIARRAIFVVYGTREATIVEGVYEKKLSCSRSDVESGVGSDPASPSPSLGSATSTVVTANWKTGRPF
jgi:hypothetical protein